MTWSLKGCNPTDLALFGLLRNPTYPKSISISDILDLNRELPALVTLSFFFLFFFFLFLATGRYCFPVFLDTASRVVGHIFSNTEAKGRAKMTV